MQNVDLLHTPKWTQVGEDWQLLVRNKSVALLIPVSEEKFPHIHWVSVLYYYDDLDWHTVDFETLESAMCDTEQWWLDMCRGLRPPPPSEAGKAKKLIVLQFFHGIMAAMTQITNELIYEILKKLQAGQAEIKLAIADLKEGQISKKKDVQREGWLKESEDVKRRIGLEFL